MRLTVLQLAATWNQSPAVLDRVDALLAAGPATDVVLLPEAAVTGYVSPELDFDLARYAEPELGPTFEALARLARRHRCAIVGPLILRDVDLHNAMVGVDARGEHLFTYAKRHPWYPETWATAGSAPPPVVEIAGHDVTVAICYDLQFVDADPQDTLLAADVLLFPSAWVDPDGTRLPLLAALARRFDLWIANANWSHGVVGIDGQEDSCIVSPSGEIVAHAGVGEGRIDWTCEA